MSGQAKHRQDGSSTAPSPELPRVFAIRNSHSSREFIDNKGRVIDLGGEALGRTIEDIRDLVAGRRVTVVCDNRDPLIVRTARGVVNNLFDEPAEGQSVTYANNVPVRSYEDSPYDVVNRLGQTGGWTPGKRKALIIVASAPLIERGISLADMDAVDAYLDDPTNEELSRKIIHPRHRRAAGYTIGKGEGAFVELPS